MPVIGRLDRQVSDVLIEPVGKNRTRDERDSPAAPTDTPTDATGDQVPRDEERGRAEQQLPVWLL